MNVTRTAPHRAATRVLRRAWRRVAPVVVVSAFYFGVLVYPVLRIRGLILDTPPGTGALLAIMVGPIAARLAYEFVPGPFTRLLSALALTWLGICFIAFTIVLGFEIVIPLLPFDDRGIGLMLLGLVTAVSGYGFLNAHRLTVIEHSIDTAGSAPGLRLAQISDVHVGSRSGRLLTRVVRRVNALHPDYVLITGDLIDFENIGTDEIAALARLDAPAYFIIGNHERYVDLDAICERLTTLGVRVLRNESVIDGTLQIVGIDDAEQRTQVAAELARLSPAPEKFRILLYHRPDGAHDAADWGAHLMLCGHTHNGQIVPFNLIVRRVFPRICGRYEIGAMTLYVSPGTGTWGPVLRLGSRSEIGIFTLT